MKILTSRLILRYFKTEDVDDLFRNINNLNVAKYTPCIPHPYSKEDAEFWINLCNERSLKSPQENYDLGIELKTEERIIGSVGLEEVDLNNSSAGLVGWLGESYWGRGYMVEAADSILDFGFNTLNLRRIELLVFADNLRMTQLAKRLGATSEGIKRQAIRAESTGLIHDQKIYSILRSEYIHK